MFRSGNPILRDDTFKGLPRAAGETMTLQGTVNKTGLSLLILLAAASYTWQGVTRENPVSPLLWVGLLGGLVLALATSFKPVWAPFTTPLYAALEGLFLGGISGLYELRYPGLVMNAVGLTFGCLAALLLTYSTGLIRPSEKFKTGVMVATGGVALLYLVSMGLGFFGKTVPLIHDSGTIGIAFSVFVVALAAMNLVLDFDFIESGAQRGAPKYMEWFGAFALLVTLVWLYLEMLRLLAKLQNRK
jgi:uncharacterized YccA/Bax inhibitor family protein